MGITISISLIIIVAVIIYTLFRRRQGSTEKNQHSSNENSLADSASKLTAEDFSLKYNKRGGRVKGGSLCFFGHWFGKPYDNYHELKVSRFNSEMNILTLTFDEKETLTVFNPQNILEQENKLTIGSADKVIWKWYYYGRPQTDSNLYFIEITRESDELQVNTNINYYQPNFKELSIAKPALLWSSY